MKNMTKVGRREKKIRLKNEKKKNKKENEKKSEKGGKEWKKRVIIIYI